MVIEKYFRIANFIDEARWGRKRTNQEFEDNLGINFYRDNLSPEVKLLTHWFCYITNRQLDYQRIWDVGGYVFSDMAKRINRNNFRDLLNPNNRGDSFFVKNIDKFTFSSISPLTANKILTDEYDLETNEKVTFSSRYIPTDYKSIICTYMLLESLDCTFTDYLIETFEKAIDGNTINLDMVAFYYSLLSYYNIGQVTHKSISKYNTFIREVEIRTLFVYTIFNNTKLFEKEFTKFKKNKYIGKKRIWCTLRDHLKWPELNGLFIDVLKQNGYSQTKLLTSIKTLTQLELPGDVWNNKPVFWKCLLKDTDYSDSKEKYSQLLRKIYYDEEITIGYPEQFDFTFNFVSRMCLKNNCDICIFKELQGNKSKFQKLCVNDPNKLCSVLLVYCDYLTNCQEDCELLAILNK